MPKVNTEFLYYGHHIIKVWEQYLKSKVDNLKFYIGRDGLDDNLFDDLSQRHEVVLITTDGKPYLNKDNHSVTLCGEIDHKGPTAGDNIKLAIEQIKSYFPYFAKSIVNHIILFPYHPNDLHWNLGVIILQFELIDNTPEITQATVNIYEPLGGQNCDDELRIRETLQSCVTREINYTINKLNHPAQQQDSSSCGAISAQNGKEFLKPSAEADDFLKIIYSKGAKELREDHLLEIGSTTFNEIQFEKHSEVKGNEYLANDNDLVQRLLIVIQGSQNDQIKQIIQLIVKNNVIDPSYLKQFKDFLIDHDRANPKNLIAHKILEPNDELKDGGIELIERLTSYIEDGVAETEHSQRQTTNTNYPELSGNLRPSHDLEKNNVKCLNNDLSQMKLKGSSKATSIDYLQQIEGDHARYSASKTLEKGHPNNDNKLYKIINQALEKENINTLEEFHNTVYNLLRLNNTHDQAKLKYSFTYEINMQGQPIVLHSNNLLFYLVANNESEKIKSIIRKYAFPISSVQDDQHNNVLHLAAFQGNTTIIKDLFRKYKKSLDFAQLINHRNNEGTNPLGMTFLNNSDDKKLVEIIKLFVGQKAFRINDYLNNKKGMDYSSDQSIQAIGGFNVLHMALKKGYLGVLEFLSQRNYKIGWENSDDCCNFLYPSLNPNHHMNSPTKILESYQGQNKAVLESILATMQQQQQVAEDNDSSGDSSDEDSWAFFYKEALQDLKKITQVVKCTNSSREGFGKVLETLNTMVAQKKIEEIVSILGEQPTMVKEHSTIVIPHFHGIPFMQGQYTNHARRTVAKKMLEFNKRVLFSLEVNKDVREDSKEKALSDVVKGIHSRTSTATTGIENLYELVKADASSLSELHRIDKKIINNLTACWKETPKKIFSALETYVYSFAYNDSMRKVWDGLGIRQELQEEIVKYRFPFVSCSKAPDHAVRFASGHHVEIGSKGELPLYPKYNNEGTPKHRLAGLLFVTAHKLKKMDIMEYRGEVFDITKLLKTKKLCSKDSHIDNQIESTFIGGINGENIIAIIPIVYPNFNKTFDPAYHAEIFDLTNETKRGPKPAYHWTEAKNIFTDKEFSALYDNSAHILPAGRVIIPAFGKLALDLAHAITKKNNQKLCYYSPDGKLNSYSTSSEYSKGQKGGDDYFSKTQRDVAQNLKPTVEVQDYSIVSKKISLHMPSMLRVVVQEGNEQLTKSMLNEMSEKQVGSKGPKDKETALHKAAREGHKIIVKLLLDKMRIEDIELKNQSGYSALDIAKQKGSQEIIELINAKSSCNHQVVASNLNCDQAMTMGTISSESFNRHDSEIPKLELEQQSFDRPDQTDDSFNHKVTTLEDQVEILKDEVNFLRRELGTNVDRVDILERMMQDLQNTIAQGQLDVHNDVDFCSQ